MGDTASSRGPWERGVAMRDDRDARQTMTNPPGIRSIPEGLTVTHVRTRGFHGGYPVLHPGRILLRYHGIERELGSSILHYVIVISSNPSSTNLETSGPCSEPADPLSVIPKSRQPSVPPNAAAQ